MPDKAKASVNQAVQDEALIARLAAGDTAALSLLYDRYAGAVFSLVARIIGDRQVAEDLLQEVFVRVWQRAGTYQGARGKPLTWVLGIAHNLAIDEVRRRRRRPLEADERDEEGQLSALQTLSSDDPGPAELAWEQVRREQIVAALEQLPDAQRILIELAYFEGYTQSQLATRLGEPLGTIKTRMRLAVQKLRELLRDLALEVR
ncbi:MAG: sigma-70 family RNA polymerase sigma factor [Thermomicrobiales bacterium]